MRSTTSSARAAARELERVDPIGVFLGPPAIVAPPDKAREGSDVVRASKSVVRVTGIACGLGVEGSGGSRPRPGRDERTRGRGHRRPRVDTSGGRHFTRRSSRSTRERPGGATRARAGGPPSHAAAPERGAAVALVGYPRTAAQRTAARLGGTADVLSRDAYGRGRSHARSLRSAARSSPGAPADRASTRRDACERPCSHDARARPAATGYQLSSCRRRSRGQTPGVAPTDCTGWLSRPHRGANAADGGMARLGRAIPKPHHAWTHS